MKKRLLSLFSGCGGMDIGFEGGFLSPTVSINKNIHANWIDSNTQGQVLLKETIFETVFANDINKYARIAWNNYFSKKRGKDVNGTYSVKSIVDIVKAHQEGKEMVFPDNIAIVTGGFPCQDFSVAGKRKGFNSHKNHKGKITNIAIPTEETRGKLYMWMRAVIQVTKPNMFIAENVKGLATMGQVKETIQKDFASIDGESYLVLPPRVLHAGNFGIPQSRQRIFFIGFKKSALTQEALLALSKHDISEAHSPYPSPTHRINGKIHATQNEYLLAKFTKSKEVLTDLPEPDQANDLSQKYFSKAKFMGVHCQGQKEISLEKLAPTIRAEHHGNIEFRRLSKNNGGKYIEELESGKIERRLTVRECARLQTFPDDYHFVIPSAQNSRTFELSPSQAYKLIGNAVPPLLAYHIAKKIESNWAFYFTR